MPKVLQDATIAIEDERFYKHTGVDYEGIIRAAVKNATSHKTVQGGSTLTMQLVRKLYTQDAHARRHRGLQAQDPRGQARRELEDKHSKKWVLGKYLNTVPYGTYGGQTAIGAGAAARLYFDKRVEGPDAARGRDARRHAAGAVDVLAGGQPRAAPRRAATRCWARWPSSG